MYAYKHKSYPHHSTPTYPLTHIPTHLTIPLLPSQALIPPENPTYLAVPPPAGPAPCGREGFHKQPTNINGAIKEGE